MNTVRVWDHYDFWIAGHLLPALIQEDPGDLDDDECLELLEFENDARATARAAGWVPGHWACDDVEPDNYRRCRVTAKFSACVRIQLMVYKDHYEEDEE